MQTLSTPKLHAKVDVEAISPDKGGKYSPNLYQFMKEQGRRLMAEYGRVFRDTEDTLWLGYFFDGAFIGVKLMRVLGKGAAAEVYSYSDSSMRDMVEVQGFWDQYVSVGRCAVDTRHQMGFIGDSARWAHYGEHRSCQWCGQVTQKLEKYTFTEVRERWVTTNK